MNGCIYADPSERCTLFDLAAGQPTEASTMALPSILSDSQKARSGNTNPFILIQSSAAQTALPVLRKFIEGIAANGDVLLVSSLYTPEDLLGQTYKNDYPNVRAVDWTSCVPGYSKEELGYDQKVKVVDDALKGVSQSSTS